MVKDIYYAEKKILKALPKMARHATHPKLVRAFETHREETEGQVERLEKVFKEISEKPAGMKCDAMDRLAVEADELMKELKDEALLNAGLLAGAQAVEHYEIRATVPWWPEQKRSALRAVGQALASNAGGRKENRSPAQQACLR
jgi:ferritin-like metal-binding protein YciE